MKAGRILAYKLARTASADRKPRCPRCSVLLKFARPCPIEGCPKNREDRK